MPQDNTQFLDPTTILANLIAKGMQGVAQYLPGNIDNQQGFQNLKTSLQDTQTQTANPGITNIGDGRTPDMNLYNITQAHIDAGKKALNKVADANAQKGIQSLGPQAFASAVNNMIQGVGGGQGGTTGAQTGQPTPQFTDNSHPPQQSGGLQATNFLPAQNYIQPNNNPIVALTRLLGFGNSPEQINAMGNYNFNMAQAQGLRPENQLQMKVAEAQQVPPTQYETGQLRALQNTAQLTAMQNSVTSLQARRDALNTEFEQEAKTMSMWGKLGGLVTFQGQQMTPRMKAIRLEQQGDGKNSKGIDGVLAHLQSVMANYQAQNPKAAQGNVQPGSNFEEGSVYKDKYGNTVKFQNGKFLAQ